MTLKSLIIAAVLTAGSFVLAWLLAEAIRHSERAVILRKAQAMAETGATLYAFVLWLTERHCGPFRRRGNP